MSNEGTTKAAEGQRGKKNCGKCVFIVRNSHAQQFGTEKQQMPSTVYK